MLHEPTPMNPVKCLLLPPYGQANIIKMTRHGMIGPKLTITHAIFLIITSQPQVFSSTCARVPYRLLVILHGHNAILDVFIVALIVTVGNDRISEIAFTYAMAKLRQTGEKMERIPMVH